MAELNVVDALLFVFGFGSLTRSQDGTWSISKIKREDGTLSSPKEPSNEDMELGMKPLRSQEDTETSTEHGPEAPSNMIRCQRCDGTGWTSAKTVICPSCKGNGEFAMEEVTDKWPCGESSDHQHHIDSRGICEDCNCKVFPEKQFEGQTGHPDTKPELGGSVGRTASRECNTGHHEQCGWYLCMCRHHGRLPGDVASEEKDNDPVNHPQHYIDADIKCRNCGYHIECIDVIEHFNALRSAAMKYLWRAGKKGNTKQDLSKARWYINREIANLDNEASKNR